MSEKFKPSLACDLDLSKIKYPCFVLQKIDGVRGMVVDGKFVGRSLKSFKNKYITKLLSNPMFDGFDGEIVVGKWNDQDLCRNTTSAVNTIEGEFDFVVYLFDLIEDGVAYSDRLRKLELRVDTLPQEFQKFFKVVPYFFVQNEKFLLELEAQFLESGFEGLIVRDINAVRKNGRSSVKSGEYLRLKRFSDAEGVVVSFEEAVENTNPKVKNELGLSERSSHVANMIPKGQVGNITVRLLDDMFLDGKLLHKKNDCVTIGPGAMTHRERTEFFNNPTNLVGKIAKFKFFGKGVKDTVRFPTFLSLRAYEDL